MADTGYGFDLNDGDWTRVRQLFQLIGSSLRLGPTSQPTFNRLTLTTLAVSGISRLDGGVGVGADPTGNDMLSLCRDSANYTAIKIDNEGAGDAIVAFYDTSVKWIMGHDTADGSFKIDQNIGTGGFTGAQDFVLDTSGNLTISGSMSADDYDGVILAAEVDGFSLTGGTTPRILIVTGGDWTLDQSVASGANVTLGTIGCGAITATYINITTEASGYQIDGSRILTNVGTDCLFLGVGAGVNNSGTGNLFIGADAGGDSCAGNTNVAVGKDALLNITSGDGNVAIGSSAGRGITTVNANFALGQDAMYRCNGAENVVIGYAALYGAASSTAHHNTVVGSAVLYNATSAEHNVGVGYNALLALTSGVRNTAIGNYALDALTTNNYNVAIGYNALSALATADRNTAIGYGAGAAVTGEKNTLIGMQAGGTLSAGTGNVFIGHQAGYYETGSSKLFIDNAARASEADGRVKALIYGVFAAAVADQDLVFNANVGINKIPTAALSMGNDALIAADVNAGLTASTTQSQGQGALTAQANEISTVANKDDTVTLPSAVTGIMIEIINNGANTLQIFPASGDDLGLGVNAAEELEANERVGFVAYDTTNWAKEFSTEIIHAEIHDEDNTDAFVINDAGGDFHSYHTNGLAAGDLADWTFDAGGAGTSFPIASIADGADSGVDIAVTTTGLHGLEVGDIISQTNLTDSAYVGIFEVKAIISTTIYEVAAVYTADGTGTMDQAATLEANAVAAGVYSFAYCISGTSSTNNETVDFQLHKEATAVVGSKVRRKFGTASDFGAMSGCGVVTVASGDKISLALSNEDSAGNITLRNFTLVLIRL